MKSIYTISLLFVISISNLFSQNMIWEKINTSGSGFNKLQVNPYTKELFASGSAGIFLRTPTGTINWQNVYGNLPELATGFRCFTIDKEGNIYASLDGSANYFFKSVDNGINYSNIMNSPICNGPGSMGINPSNGYIYLGMWDPGCQYILRSTDGGLSYSQVYPKEFPNEGPDESKEFAFKGNDSVFIVDTGVYRSTNAGQNWTNQNSGLPNNNVYAITIDDEGTIYIGLSVVNDGGGVFKSTNNGGYWQAVANNYGLTNKNINDIAIAPNRDLYAATNGGIFILKSDSSKWESFINDRGLSTNKIDAIIISDDGNIFCANGDVYKLSIDTANNSSLKIIGLTQNCHDNPNCTNPGIKLTVNVPQSDNYNNVRLYWKKKEGLLPQANEFTRITGSNYWQIIIDQENYLGKLKAGDIILWHIEAIDKQGNQAFIPGQNQDETTTIYSYQELNNGLVIKNGVNGYVTPYFENNELKIANNKTVYLDMSQDGDVKDFTVNGCFICSKDENSYLLSAKSFPLGFFLPPKLGVQSLESLGLEKNTKFILSKFGKNYNALTMDAIEIFMNLVGITGALKNDKDIKIMADFYNILKNIALPIFKGQDLRNQGTLNLLLSELIKQIIEHAIENPNVYIDIISKYLGEEIAKNLILNNCSGALKVFTSGSDIALKLYDFFIPPVWEDIVTIKKSNGHWMEVKPLILTGKDKAEIPGSQTQYFSFKITNVSNQKLYNVWLGLDIYAYDETLNKYIKIENTKTPITDPETDKIGKINFDNYQGNDLDSGQSIIFFSNPYPFDVSVTGFKYHSWNRSYRYIYNVWTNGYPGQQTPIAAKDLASQTVPIDFYLGDYIKPQKPFLSVLEDYNASTVFNWNISQVDEQDIDTIAVYNGNNQISTIDARAVAGLKQFPIIKTDAIQNIKIQAVDIHGNKSDFSNELTISKKTTIPEFIFSKERNERDMCLVQCPVTVMAVQNDTNKIGVDGDSTYYNQSKNSTVLYETIGAPMGLILPVDSIYTYEIFFHENCAYTFDIWKSSKFNECNNYHLQFKDSINKGAKGIITLRNDVNPYNSVLYLDKDKDGYYEVYIVPTLIEVCDSIKVTDVNAFKEKSVFDLNIEPNPNNGNFAISYNLSESELINISISDINGNLITKILNNELYEPGFHNIQKNLNLFPGTYFCTIRAGKFIETKKFIIIY